ncbi:SphA family protein [Paraburkholderia sediminicola]|uniref:SphA family protein n=1 Tax=Paraburkholderia sediminicola TaxID=458836 RepID=UPI0038BAD7F6
METNSGKCRGDRMLFQKLAGAAIVAGAVVCTSAPTYAAEGITYGGPRGGTDINGAYLPQASGFYGIALLFVAAPDRYYGNNGGPSGLDFRGKAAVPGLGLLYVYPFKLAGGTLGSSVLETYSASRLCVNGTCRTTYEWGDLYSDILMWSRHIGTRESPNGLPYGLTVKAAFSMQFPTGKYETTAPTPSFGNNVYRIIPNVALTYLTGPNAIGDGVEFSAQVFYATTTKNTATDYNSGDTVDIDVGISERTGRWQYGLAGNYAFQLQGDKQYGVELPGGNKIGIVTLGPVVAYQIPSWKSEIKAKLQLPVYTRNTAHQVAGMISIVKAF